jgi:hypothetical protein
VVQRPHRYQEDREQVRWAGKLQAEGVGLQGVGLGVTGAHKLLENLNPHSRTGHVQAQIQVQGRE